jgi:transposase
MGQRVMVGLDLGGGFHQVQVTSESGERLGRSFRIRRGRRGLEALLAGVRRVAGEATEPVFSVEATRNYWQELVHPLQRLGHTVYLISPNTSAALRSFIRDHTKNDCIDADALARVPLVHPRLHPRPPCEPRAEAILRLVRLSWSLRAQIADRKKRILDRADMVYPGYGQIFRHRYGVSSLLFIRRYLNPAKARRLGARRLGRLLLTASWGKLRQGQLQRLWQVIENAPDLAIDYDVLQFAVAVDLDLLETEERTQSTIRQRVAELYAELDPEARLTSIPGLGDFLGAAVTAFIGDVRRFDSADQVVALAGLAPRQHTTAGHDRPNQPMTKHGDPVLRGCLYYAAGIARQYDPELQAFYTRLRERGKHHNVAQCALAAKLLRRCVALLRDGRPYQLERLKEIQRLQDQEGKTVRRSVFEVAERLKDESGSASPGRRVYADRSTPATESSDQAPVTRMGHLRPSATARRAQQSLDQMADATVELDSQLVENSDHQS